ncbi:molybdenum cofactor biosynthesis protein MoaE, partial [Capnocytophaga haemolytica]
MDIKIKNIFKEGAIPPSLVAESIAKHQVKTEIGGHSIFLGQIRADQRNGKNLTAMEFTTHTEMALEQA